MTRYPSAGKGNKWTVLELKAMPIEWKGDTLNDSGGLSGDVRVNANGDITVAFRLAFKLNGSSKVNWCQSASKTFHQSASNSFHLLA